MITIIDCDPGNGIPGANVDDALALTFALRSAVLHVGAVWTVSGNTSAYEGAQAAQSLVEHYALSDIPVVQGISTSLSGNTVQWRKKLDMPSQSPDVYQLWGRQTAPFRINSAQDTHALHELEASLSQISDDITFAALGPLTNLASLLKTNKGSVEKIKRIFIMGGCLGEGDLVDTNFAVDPQAAQIVLESGIPTTLIPLDLTRTTCLSPHQWKAIHDNCPPAYQEYAEDIATWLEPWLTYSARTRPVNGMWLHDLCVIAAIALPSIVTTERTRVALSQEIPGKLVKDTSGIPVDLAVNIDNHTLIQAWAKTVLNVHPLHIDE